MTGLSSDNALQYTGRENDGTGVFYYRARYYSPVLFRFISEDPSSGLAWNFYVYSANSPLVFTDPLGMWDTLTVVGGVVGAGAGVAALATVVAGAGAVATVGGAIVVVGGTILATQAIVSGTADVVIGAIAPKGTEIPPITPIGVATLIATGGDIKSAKAAEAAFSAGKLFVRGVNSLESLLEATKLGLEVYGAGTHPPKQGRKK